MMGPSGAGAGPSLAEDLAFARRLGDAAAELALEYFRRGVTAELKPDGSPVTEADVVVERRLRQLIDLEGGRRLDLGDGRFSNGLIHAQLEQFLAAS